MELKNIKLNERSQAQEDNSKCFHDARDLKPFKSEKQRQEWCLQRPEEWRDGGQTFKLK